jgi:3-phosphoshikimate 1-carboxyvinyltransferase
VEALRRRGARIDFREVSGQLPISILGGTLEPGRARVEASESSQYVSALLIGGAALAAPLEIEIEGPIASAPYIRMTIDSMRAFGHEVSGESPFQVRRGERPVARYEVGGDFSSAVPLLAAAGIGGGRVTAAGLHWPSSDADALVLPVFEKMGISIAAEEGSVTASAGTGRLRPVDVVATDFPDAVPALAALAAFADGRSRFRGVAHLRGKESDRIAALQAALSAAGASTSSDDASLSVEGPLARAAPVGPRRIPTAGDHRIAMAGGLLALAARGLLVENPGCVAKSYPDFFRDLESVVVR